MQSKLINFTDTKEIIIICKIKESFKSHKKHIAKTALHAPLLFLTEIIGVTMKMQQ